MAGIYIHIPYCRSKCFYCDFFSTAAGNAFGPYTEAVCRELELRIAELGGEPVKTIYLGGGTPSLLPQRELRLICEALGNVADPHVVEEFTIEGNPEDITPDNLDMWRRAGINRISIGIQSFNPRELRAIGRKHSPEASVKALQLLDSSGMNYNADLIYGLPGQSLSDWQQNLDTLLRFRPPHVSCYLLSYEPGTRLHAMQTKGMVEEASEELATDMYRSLCQRAAAAGYRHYEISNFSLPGMEARHNSAYWNYTPYLGLGAAAHSFTADVRSANPVNIKKYIETINSGLLPAETDEETPADRLNDYVITSLRTAAGFSPSFSVRRFAEGSLEKFNSNLSSLLASDPKAIELTPEGNLRIPECRWLTADAVLRELIVD